MIQKKKKSIIHYVYGSLFFKVSFYLRSQELILNSDQIPERRGESGMVSHQEYQQHVPT